MQNNEKIGVRAEEEINLLHWVVVILKRKGMILGITLICALITAVISFIMTPIYRAETRILPPKQSSAIVSDETLNQLGGGLGLIGSSLGIKNPNDVYVGILKSRTVYDRIIDRFGLMEEYEAENREDARKALGDSISVENGKDGIISVSVEDKDPKRAADMANAFIEELKDITQTLAVTEASKRRLFFEEQLRKVKEDLIKAEEAMRSFQEKTGAVKMDAQAEAVIESIAQLRSQIAAKEVEFKVMKTYTTLKNPDLQRVEEELRGMKEQLLKLEAKSGNNPDPLVPTGRLPKISSEYIRKLRELKYYETLLDIMAKQYEIARVDESRDATIIQVLDRALPPEKIAKPKRFLMIALATITGFFVAIFAAFLTEYVERISHDPENKETIEMIKRYAFHGRKQS